MTIEFRCTMCDKLLRTPDGTGGKKAKCPECGTILSIPPSSTAAPRTAPSASAPSASTPSRAPNPPVPSGPSPFMPPTSPRTAPPTSAGPTPAGTPTSRPAAAGPQTQPSAAPSKSPAAPTGSMLRSRQPTVPFPTATPLANPVAPIAKTVVPPAGPLDGLPEALEIPGSLDMPAPPLEDSTDWYELEAPPPRLEPSGNNPFQSPQASLDRPRSAARAGEIQPTRVSMGEILGTTWRIFVMKFGPCSLGVLLTLLVMLPLALVAMVLVGVFLGVTQLDRHFAPLVMLPVFLLALGYPLVGFVRYMMQQARGEPRAVSALFPPLPLAGRALAAGFLMLMAVFLPIVPAIVMLIAQVNPIIPAIWFTVALIADMVIWLTFLQVFFLVLDEQAGLLDSFNTSMAVMRGNKFSVWGALFVTNLVSQIIGFVTLNVAMLVTLPFTVLLYCVVYLSVTGQATAADRAPASRRAEARF